MSLVEALVVLAILTLGLVAAATRLQSSTATSATSVGERISSLTAASATAPNAPGVDPGATPNPGQAAPRPPEPKKSGWSKFWDGAKKVGGFLLDNFTPVGDIKTLLDPNASTLDKILAGTSILASVVPVPGVGPGVKAATKAARFGAKAARDAKDAERAVQAAKDAERGGKAAKDAERGGEGAGKRPREEDPEPNCEEGVCRAGPGKNCFAAGTLVFTEAGDRPIESIAQGDRVWSRDPVSGVLALKTVLQTFAHDSYVIDLVTADASHAEHLTVTPNHPFWVEGAGWVAAGALEGSALLWTPVGALTAHAAASWGERTKVYNLEVADSHTYFVGALHAWVHNQGGTGCPEASEPADPPKKGETSATKRGKEVHAERAAERRASGDWDEVNAQIKDEDGNVIEVPKRVDLKTGKPRDDRTQAAQPDAVSYERGEILDDKPAGRPVSKDRQEIIRFITAYREKTGKDPEKIIIERYDPKTGAPAGRETYSPGDFLP